MKVFVEIELDHAQHILQAGEDNDINEALETIFQDLLDYEELTHKVQNRPG